MLVEEINEDFFLVVAHGQEIEDEDSRAHLELGKYFYTTDKIYKEENSPWVWTVTDKEGTKED
jgi:hypothetical protein